MDGIPEAKMIKIYKSTLLSGCNFDFGFKSQNFSVTKRSVRKVSPTCVGITWFTGSGAHASSGSFCPAVPPTQQVWLAG